MSFYTLSDKTDENSVGSGVSYCLAVGKKMA